MSAFLPFEPPPGGIDTLTDQQMGMMACLIQPLFVGQLMTQRNGLSTFDFGT